MKTAPWNWYACLSVAFVAALALGSLLPTASGQDNHWTGGPNANWWDAANWDAGVPGAAHDVIFGTPVPGSGPAIALGAGSVANSLWIEDNYAFSGGNLTLTSGAIRVNLGHILLFDSQLSGSAGLTRTGGGSLRLTDAMNDFTGDIVLSDGSLIITDPAQLGASTSAIVVTESNPTPSSTALRAFAGGSLVLDGSMGGFTFSRDLSVQGMGPISDRSGAVRSIGDNTLSGQVSMAVGSPTARSTRIIANNGTLTLSGGLHVAGTAGTTISTLGGQATTGAGGGFLLTGVLTGTGTLEKSGAGTLFLTPSDTSGFTGRLRVSANTAAGGQSSVRVTSATDSFGNSIFGMANSGTSSAPIDLNGGVLEIRSDTSLDLGKNVYTRSTGNIFAAPAAGGTEINGTVTFGALRQNASGTNATNTTTFNSRNGYGVTFSTFSSDTSTSSSTLTNTLTNNMGGTLTFTGDVSRPEGNTASRPRVLAIGGNGNTMIMGSIIAGTDTGKSLTKTGSGSLTILGTNTTLNGAVNINGGTLVITDFRSLNNNTATVNLGTSSTAGALIVGTDQAPAAAGLTTSKRINLAGTTGSASIYANQTGPDPVILDGNFTVTGNGAKTLFLGGTNTADNVINGAIPNSTSATSLTKIGTGTWVLAGENTYTGTTTLVSGTLTLQANAADSTVLPATNAVTFLNLNVHAGATLEFVGQDSVNNVQSLGALTVSQGANTIKLTPGDGGTASLVFSSLGSVSGAASLNILGSGSGNTVTLTGVADGLASPTIFLDSSNLAYAQSGVLRPVVYGTDSGFKTTSGGTNVLSIDHWEITGNVNQTASTNLRSLRIVNSTLDGGSGAFRINEEGNSGSTGASTHGVIISSGTSSISGSSVHTAGSGTLVLNVVDGTLTLNALVHGNTTGGLTKTGAGTLVIAGLNNQTGTISINEGTVQLAGSGRLGAISSLTLRQDGTLDLNGVTPGTNTNSFNNNGIVTNSSATAVTFTVGGSSTGSGTGNSYGIIQETNGVINLTKVGTGAQSWLGNSTYTGVTTIGASGASGSLVTVNTLADIGQPSGIGRGNAASDATNAASLVFTGTGGAGLIYQGNIVEGDLVLGSRSASTNRLFTLAGSGETSIYSNATNGNAIVWSNTGAIAHTGEAERTIVFMGTSTGDNTFNPQITDSGTGANVTSVRKANAGQWNLGNPNNTYTGPTTVGFGILALNNNGALPSGSPVVLGRLTAAGILQMSGTFERPLAQEAVAGSGTVTWGGTTGGGGFAAHSDKLVVAIGGVASPTPLTWGSGGFVGTGGVEQALLLNSTSALAEVEFRNAIDLGNLARTVTVDDNTTTGADFATLSGALSGGASGSLIKAGAGTLRLTGANTYGGATTVNAGVLAVTSLGHSGTAGATSVGDQLGANLDSSAVALGSGSTAGLLQYLGTGEISDRKIRFRSTTGNPQIHADGSGPLILTNVANDMGLGAKILYLRGTNPDGNMITSPLSDNGGALGLSISGSATWILTNGGNSYTGNTTSTAGALGIGHDTALGGSTLVLDSGVIFAYGADRTIANTVNHNNGATQGFIGDHSLTFTGDYRLLLTTGSGTTRNTIVAGKGLVLGNVTANSLTAGCTWTIDGSGETIINGNISTNTAHGLSITKAGTGLLQLNGVNTTTGAMNVNQGVLRINTSQDTTGALRFGSANNTVTAGTLELKESSSFGSMTAQTASTANTSILMIDPGKTLTVNGNVTIGSGQAASTTTLFAATGGGDMVVNNAAASGVFAVGGSTSGSGLGNMALADLSGLNSLTVTLSGGTSTFRVNPTNSSNVTDKYSMLILPSTGAGTTTITANSLLIGSSGQFNGGAGQINQMRLGSGLTTLNLNSVNIAHLANSGDRDYGSIVFDGASGSLVVRAADGAGRAAFNMGTGNAAGTATVSATGNSFDVAGHSADLLFDAVSIGTQNRGHTLHNTFSFDTGTLDMNSLVMSRRTANPTTGTAANWITNSTMNLGGGTVNINGGITSLAQITGSLNAATRVNATVNISGGTVSIGQTGGTSVTMATASAGTANAVLNLTGGSTTLAGSLVRGGGAGTTSATVTLDGGALDMGGNTIGTAASQITFNTHSGTLANLGELNGGGALAKTTGGTLILDGVNTYSGPTSVNAGTLLVHGTHTGGGAYTVQSGATLGGTGSIGSAVGVNAGGRLAPGASIGTLAIGDHLTLAGGSTFQWEFNSDTVTADLLNLDGDLTLDLLGGVALDLVDLADPARPVPYGTTFTMISYSGDWNGGVFEDYPHNSMFTFGQNEWRIRYNDLTAGVNGGSFANFVTLTIVPEPSCVVLLVGAVLGLLLGRRR